MQWKINGVNACNCSFELVPPPVSLWGGGGGGGGGEGGSGASLNLSSRGQKKWIIKKRKKKPFCRNLGEISHRGADGWTVTSWLCNRGKWSMRHINEPQIVFVNAEVLLLVRLYPAGRVNSLYFHRTSLAIKPRTVEEKLISLSKYRARTSVNPLCGTRLCLLWQITPLIC